MRPPGRDVAHTGRNEYGSLWGHGAKAAAAISASDPTGWFIIPLWSREPLPRQADPLAHTSHNPGHCIRPPLAAQKLARCVSDGGNFTGMHVMQLGLPRMR